jgi:hypothetical protein
MTLFRGIAYGCLFELVAAALVGLCVALVVVL